MKYYWICGCRFWWAGLLLILVIGCAHKPFDPPRTDEIPKGPGLFSKGDDGVVLFDSRRSKSDEAVEPEAVPAGDQSDHIKMSDEDFAEFEAFRQWMEWKKSNAGSEEYENFKQWQEWRRYQDWKHRKDYPSISR